MMREYEDLTFLVEVKWPSNCYFEQIAAFNSEDIARQYAKDCFTGNDGFMSYRVRERRGENFFEIAAFSS